MSCAGPVYVRVQSETSECMRRGLGRSAGFRRELCLDAMDSTPPIVTGTCLNERARAQNLLQREVSPLLAHAHSEVCGSLTTTPETRYVRVRSRARALAG